MPLLALVLILSMVVLDTAHEALSTEQTGRREHQARALGADMLIVRNALATLVQAAPSTSGAVALTDLGLPDWFRPDPALRAFVQSGRAFVYVSPTDAKADLAATLGAAPPGLTGIARDAQLVSPGMLTTIALPSIIPDNSLVLMF